MSVIKKTHSTPDTQRTLLFVHGWAADSRVWEYQIDGFSKSYSIITLNLPGHGEGDNWFEPSLKPAIEKVLRAMRHASRTMDFIGIGWSLGASVLMAAASVYPKLFKGLVLIGATPCFAAKDGFPWVQQKGIAKRMLKDLKGDCAKTLSRFYPLNFTDNELGEKEAKRFMEYYTNMEMKTGDVIASFDALINLDARDDIKNISSRTLIVHGNKDAICPVGAGEYLARNIRGACLKIFENTGHAPFLTQAGRFNKMVKEFLKDI